jgi:hypothetical protein
MPLPFQFASVTTLVTPQLDADFAAVGALGFIPCSPSGTNNITLTPNPNTPTISNYSNPLYLMVLANSTNSGAVTLQVNGLGFLNVYKISKGGAVGLSPGDITSGNLALFMYSPFLNSGNGGFFLVNPALRGISSSSLAATFTSVPGNSSQDQLVSVAGVLTGDCIVVNPVASLPAGVLLDSYALANNTITLRLGNLSTTSIASLAVTVNVVAIGH